METLKTLEEQVDDLKKQLWYLQSKVIPELQAKIESNTDSEENQTTGQWETIYDMESTDDALNCGNTTGILLAAGLINYLPDLEPYNYMRVHIRTNAVSHSCHIINIGESRDSLADVGNTQLSHLCVTSNYLANNVILTNIALTYDADGKRIINMSSTRMITFNTNKYPSITVITNNTTFFVEKIEVMI